MERRNNSDGARLSSPLSTSEAVETQNVVERNSCRSEIQEAILFLPCLSLFLC